MMRIFKAKAVAALQEQLPSHSLSPDNISVLHQGRFANAIVFRYQDEDLDLVIKDYSHCPAPLKQSIGRLFIKREHQNLRRRSEEHTSELQSRPHLVCRLLLE